jgi:hypothetical protein
MRPRGPIVALQRHDRAADRAWRVGQPGLDRAMSQRVIVWFKQRYNRRA